MDVTLLSTLAMGFIVLIFIVKTILRRKSGQLTDDSLNHTAPRVQPARRAAGVRNARRRMRGSLAATPVAVNQASQDEVAASEDKTEIRDSKYGAKKRAKLEAKADKKIQREAAERDREERKKREILQQEESDKQRAKEQTEEQLREEALKSASEEKAMRDHEEYMRMKETFSVEEEGYNEKDDVEQQNLLREFVEYIQRNKVVILEDLSAYFGMKTASVIERIHNLLSNGTLTGVIDDRGKFIYIPQDELEAVAKFVRQQGRVSITELAESSNRLINLNPGSKSKIIKVN